MAITLSLVYAVTMNSQLSRIITGLMVLSVGVAFFISNLGGYNFGEMFAIWWPSLLVVAGVILLIDNYKNYLWAIILIGFGGLYQLNRLDIIEANPWHFLWPTIIIAVGLSILLRQSGKRPVDSKNSHNISAILSGADVKSGADDYSGGNITAIMGVAKLDLHNATIKNDATLDIFGLMGSIELIVPRGVTVVNRVAYLMGGIEDRSDSSESKKGPTLTLVGSATMASIEVKN